MLGLILILGLPIAIRGAESASEWWASSRVMKKAGTGEGEPRVVTIFTTDPITGTSKVTTRACLLPDEAKEVLGHEVLQRGVRRLEQIEFGMKVAEAHRRAAQRGAS